MPKRNFEVVSTKNGNERIFHVADNGRIDSEEKFTNFTEADFRARELNLWDLLENGIDNEVLVDFLLHLEKRYDFDAYELLSLGRF